MTFIFCVWTGRHYFLWVVLENSPFLLERSDVFIKQQSGCDLVLSGLLPSRHHPQKLVIEMRAFRYYPLVCGVIVGIQREITSS